MQTAAQKIDSTQIISGAKRDAIRGIIGRGITWLEGPVNSGKSHLALQMAMVVAGDLKLTDKRCKVRPGRVLYVSTHNSKDETRARILESGLSDVVSGKLDLAHGMPMSRGGSELLEDWCLENSYDCRLIVIDDYQDIASNPNKLSTSILGDLSALFDIEKMFDVSILVVTNPLVGRSRETAMHEITSLLEFDFDRATGTGRLTRLLRRGGINSRKAERLPSGFWRLT